MHFLEQVTGKQSMIQEQQESLISVTDHDDQNCQLYLQELRKIQQELASVIKDLTLVVAEEQIIEDEVADASHQTKSVDIMIVATISSILDNNSPKTRVLPMLPFRGDLGEDDS